MCTTRYRGLGLQSFVSFLIIGATITCYEAASLTDVDRDANDGDVSSMWSSWSVGLVVACLGVAVCGVLLIMGCTDLCQRHSGFKDFDNDAFNTDDSLSPVPVPSEFTMYPPVENTPDSVSVTPVVFEPLPDIAIRGHFGQDSNRTGRMRPRVTQDAYERSESIDSLDDIPQRDTIQDKMRLQNLLTNSRQMLPRGQLQYIKELGNGWFGKVLQGEGHGILPGHKKTKVVIQMLKEEPDTTDQLAFLEEAMAYRDTDHPNVVKLLGQCVDTAPLLNIMELCPFGDLKTYLRSHRVAMESFNEKGLLLKFACDMAAGLQALHQEGFVHRDFATRNCLLASDLSVKVGDYGVSEEAFKEDYYTDSYGDALPIRWLSPESLMVAQDEIGVRRITKEANIWAYGVTMWEILTFGSLPYGDLNNNHVIRLVVLEKSVKLPKPDVSVSNLNRLYQLMQLCWSEPGDRPSLRELRIMLLHLMSKKEDHDSTAFDLKWNQLMPRRSPRVTRVAGLEGRFQPAPLQANGSILTVSASAPAQVHGYSNGRPSALHIKEDGNGIAQLNASQLGFGGGTEAAVNPKLADNLTSTQTKELTSPVNEMSLEAEFSAANVAAVSGDESDEEIPVTNQTPGQKMDSDKQPSDGMMDVDEDLFSPIKSDDSDNFLKGPEAVDNNESVIGDQVVPNGSAKDKRAAGDDQVPEMAGDSSPVAVHSRTDFSTSTPKKSEQDTNPVDMYTTAAGGITVDSSTEGSQVTETFHTASMGFSSQSSMERSLSVEYEDRSFMGTKKFADMLQTVATLSVDEEMLDTSNEASPSYLDISEEDVFRSPMKSPLETAMDSTPADTTEDTLSADHTPRNTPSPPFATSAAPLLDVSERSQEEEEPSDIKQEEVQVEEDNPEDTCDSDQDTPTPPHTTSSDALLDTSDKSEPEQHVEDDPEPLVTDRQADQATAVSEEMSEVPKAVRDTPPLTTSSATLLDTSDKSEPKQHRDDDPEPLVTDRQAEQATASPEEMNEVPKAVRDTTDNQEVRGGDSDGNSDHSN